MRIEMILESLACDRLCGGMPERILEHIDMDIERNTLHVIEAAAFDIINEAESSEKAGGWFKTFMAFCARLIDKFMQNIKAIFTPYSTYVKKNAIAIKAGWSNIQNVTFNHVPLDYLVGHITVERNIEKIVKSETGFSIYDGLAETDITKDYGTIVELRDRIWDAVLKQHLTCDGVRYKDKNFIETTVHKSGVTADDVIDLNGKYFDIHIKTLRELIRISRECNESYVKSSSAKIIPDAVEKFSIIKTAYSIIASICSNGIYIINININQFTKLAKAAVAASA